MPQTSKEKQEAFRARRTMLGTAEVRGIYLPPELHAKLKEEALKLLRQATREEARKLREAVDKSGLPKE